MKKLILILTICILAFACRSTKKITESSEVKTNTNESVSLKKIENKTNTDEAETNSVKNDKTKVTKTTTVKETFYPPDTKPSNDKDSSKVKDNGKGAIKSTETTTTEEYEADRTIIDSDKSKKDNSTSNISEDNSTNSNDKISTQTKVSEEKTVPLPWGWIFGILLIIMGAILYFRKSKPIAWILAKIKSIFTK